MPRALAITKRQVKTLLRAADEERAIVELETPAGLMRFIPASRAAGHLLGGDRSAAGSLDEEPEGTL